MTKINELRDKTFEEAIATLLIEDHMSNWVVNEWKKNPLPDAITISELEPENEGNVASLERLLLKRGATPEKLRMNDEWIRSERAKRVLVTFGKAKIALLKKTAILIKELCDANR